MDCNRFVPTQDVYRLCLQVISLLEGSSLDGSETDKLQTQIYIVSGALGGVILILIFAVIILAVQLNRLWNRQPSTGYDASNMAKTTLAHNAGNIQDVGNTTLATPANNGGVGNGYQRFQPPSQSLYSQQPKQVTSEEELAHMGFSSYTGHPVETSRALSVSPSAVGSASGGVRVLPRNPPTGFRQNVGFNEGFM